MSLIDAPATMARLLGDLFGKPVKITASTKYDPSLSAPAVVAVYAEAEGKVGAVAVCNMSAAAYLGAALSMVPADVAKSEALKNALSAGLLENFGEVANICSQVVTDIHGSRLHLREVLPKVASPSADYKPIFATPRKRVDLEIDVTGFGKGRISLRFA